MTRVHRCGLGPILAAALAALASPSRVGAQSDADVPRPHAPRAGGCSLTATPTLRWHGGRGSSRVTVCRDRACLAVASEVEVAGEAWRPTTPLAPGVWFWRVRRGERASAVWSFTVTARPGVADATAPRCTDVDGDGFGDALMAGVAMGRQVSLLWGARTGLVRRRPARLTLPAGVSGGALALAGDLDGDGYADLLWSSAQTPSPSRRARAPRSVASLHAGAVRVFRGGPRGISATAAVRLDAREGEFCFGATVVAVGDVDGDGRGDLLADALALGRDGGLGGMRLYRQLFARGGPTVEPAPAVRCPVGAARVAAAGDVDGDGFADVAVACAVSRDAPAQPAAWVRVLHGSPNGLTRPEPLPLPEQGPPAETAVRVASLGDLDGDGFSDLIAAWHRDGAPSREALVWRGSARGFGTPEALVPPALPDPALPPEYFAWEVGALGDVDGDGRDEVALSLSDTALVLYRGGSFGAPEVVVRGDGLPVSFFGYAVPCGDVDGDGYVDVLVGDTCARTDENSGDACLRREYGLLRGGRDGVTSARMQPVLE
jgi:hypothetical protein